jgi:hypothetical protein
MAKDNIIGSKRRKDKRKVLELVAINLESKLNLRGDGFSWLSIKAAYKYRSIKGVDYNHIIMD